MKSSVPNKAEQIKALIYHKAYALAMQYAGRDKSGSPQYSKVFNVTRADIKEYIKSHYTLDNLPFARSSPTQEDGIYLIPVKNGYEMYDQERGIRFPSTKVHSDDEAWLIVIDHILRTSGTGLKWE
jgi:hypothetical protein